MRVITWHAALMIALRAPAPAMILSVFARLRPFVSIRSHSVCCIKRSDMRARRSAVRKPLTHADGPVLLGTLAECVEQLSELYQSVSGLVRCVASSCPEPARQQRVPFTREQSERNQDRTKSSVRLSSTASSLRSAARHGPPYGAGTLSTRHVYMASSLQGMPRSCSTNALPKKLFLRN